MTSLRPLAGIAAAALLLAGCSAPATTPAPAATTAPAASTSQSPAQSESAPASTPAVAITNTDDFIAQVTAAMKGITTYTYEMKMTMGTGSFEGTGEADMTNPKKPNMHMVMSAGGQSFEILSVDGDYFMRGLLGKGWTKVSETLAEQATSTSADPTAMLEETKKYIKSVEAAGAETVNGVNAQHFKVTMDVKALGDLSATGAKIDGDTLLYDYWLDESSRPVKVAFDMSDVSTTPIMMEMTMGHFNEPVKISAPKKYTEMPG
jgi:hypothetical protein